MFFANNLNINITLEPRYKKAEQILRVDPTLSRLTLLMLEKINFVRQVFFNQLCKSLNIIYADVPNYISINNILILTARVVD